MFVKPRHWNYTFPLTATMLCVSPRIHSVLNGFSSSTHFSRDSRIAILGHFASRLSHRGLWTYLYRTNDSAAGVTRKLDEVMKNVLPNSKKPFIAADTAVTDPIIQIVRIIGYKYPEYCFRNIIFPLVNADQFSSNRELKIEHLDPDKMVVGIRAFLAVMADLRKARKAGRLSPQYYASTSSSDRASPVSPAVGSPVFSPDGQIAPQEDERVSRPVLVSALTR